MGYLCDFVSPRDFREFVEETRLLHCCILTGSDARGRRTIGCSALRSGALALVPLSSHPTLLSTVQAAKLQFFYGTVIVRVSLRLHVVCPPLHCHSSVLSASKTLTEVVGNHAACHDTAVTQKTLVGGLGTSSDEAMKSSKTATPRAMAFRLSSVFVRTEGRDSKPQFGFNGLGELVYQRTYARYLGEDTDDREQW